MNTTKLNLLQSVGASFLFTIMMLFFNSCDESSVLGLEVQPESDLLNVAMIDTTSIKTQTVAISGIRTDETFTQEYTTDALIGTYVDPVFGKTTASLYTQLLSNTDAPTFGTNPIVDSVVLVLIYKSSYYGTAIAGAQNVSVYELTESMSKENSYVESSSLTKSTTDLASAYSFVPANTSADLSQLRVPLSNAFGQSILDKQGTSDLATNTDFQNFVKGLYITTKNTTGLTASQGNILRVALENAETKLRIYYRNAELDTTNVSFGLNSVARFSEFEHDYSTGHSDLTTQLAASNVAQNERVFVQGMAGTRVKITFPYLMNWLDSGSVGINGAELVIKTDATFSTSSYTPPDKLMVYGINDDGSEFVLDDVFFTDQKNIGGAYDSDKLEYRLKISNYIQQVLTGKLNNNGLYLEVLYAPIIPNRTVLGGGAPGTYQMKLNITRTK